MSALDSVSSWQTLFACGPHRFTLAPVTPLMP